ncbi:MAG: aminotransferase class V-fold PLP-dependent enzyme [Alphaproteobacteria bacterium]|tara:strand:- start:477 stop:1685 length:1209 start_codon:yes stop_codon:yes gene_type:complete
MNNFYKQNKLTPIINVSGFMTKIGASITNKESIRAANNIFQNFVNIDELQEIASKRISKCFKTESAVITASAAGGLTESVASMMTGNNLENIYQLPSTKNMKNKVLIQKGHLTNYGAEVSQGILLSGAKILSCGLEKKCTNKIFEEILIKNKNNISCAMYVVSHHCSDYEAINISDFIKICKKYRVPTIIDAASEEYMEDFFKIGADIAIFSAHKFMGSLTAGILAGKKKYIKNIYLQNLGIGRGMKVGKEAIYAAIIGVENWYQRNWKKEIEKQNNILQFWLRFLEKEKFNGISYEVVSDPTGNKINRLRIYIDSKKSKFTIQSLSHYLEKNNPAIFVRDDLIHLNHFELDTCNLKKGQEKIVMKEFKKIISKLVSKKIKNNITQKEYLNKSKKEWLSWLD